MPIVKEPRNERRHVEGDELVKGAGRQPLFRQFSRGDSAGGHQHRETAHANALEQRKYADEFADASPMHPDEQARPPRGALLAAALNDATEPPLTAHEQPSDAP